MAFVVVPDFFWFIFVFMATCCLINIPYSLYKVSKGEHSRKEKPVANAFVAVLGVLFLLFYITIFLNWHV